MKDYHKILSRHSPKDFVLIEQEWGQTAASLYAQIVPVWNKLAAGKKIFLLSRKTYGLKSILALLKEKDLKPVVVGKGEGDVRLVEIVKDREAPLSVEPADNHITFTFRDKEYRVIVGNAVFSKTGLDEGTRFLLETFLASNPDTKSKLIADLGAGWGAICIILATEFPVARIVAYEKEAGAFAACEENLKQYPNTTLFRIDLTNVGQPAIEQLAGKVDYIVSNFSFHVTAKEREQFFHNAKRLLRNGGEIFFVTEGRFVARFEKTAKTFFDMMESKEYKRYTVFRGKKVSA